MLKKELASFNNEVAPELQRRGLEWSFIPPYSPHRGGVWERVIGIFKRHMKTLSMGDPLHVDVFNTAIIEIKSIVNRRPLTAISADSSDCEAITPAHILNPAVVSHSSSLVVDCLEEEDANGFRCQWRRAQAHVNAFWRAWRRDYLTLLHDRQKWRKTRDDLREGELVLLVDEQTRRGEWKLGRIQKIERTSEHARRAWVKRADGKLVERDRTKLILLEVDIEKRNQ